APQSKETAQALSLISRHGLEKSQGVIQFARDEAAKTSYPIQHFGGVLSYTSRALSALGKNQSGGQHANQSVARQSRPVAPASPTWARGERRLECLNTEQHEWRFAQAKVELFQEHP